jgi:hypothetical protein
LIILEPSFKTKVIGQPSSTSGLLTTYMYIHLHTGADHIKLVPVDYSVCENIRNISFWFKRKTYLNDVIRIALRFEVPTHTVVWRKADMYNDNDKPMFSFCEIKTYQLISLNYC